MKIEEYLKMITKEILSPYLDEEDIKEDISVEESTIKKSEQNTSQEQKIEKEKYVEKNYEEKDLFDPKNRNSELNEKKEADISSETSYSEDKNLELIVEEKKIEEPKTEFVNKYCNSESYLKSSQQQIKQFFGKEKIYFLREGFLWSELFGPPVGLKKLTSYDEDYFF